jgi:hypothetical protein
VDRNDILSASSCNSSTASSDTTTSFSQDQSTSSASTTTSSSSPSQDESPPSSSLKFNEATLKLLIELAAMKHRNKATKTMMNEVLRFIHMHIVPHLSPDSNISLPTDYADVDKALSSLQPQFIQVLRSTCTCTFLCMVRSTSIAHDIVMNASACRSTCV